MRKILPIIFAALLLSSCLKDDSEPVTQKQVASEEEELTATDFVKGTGDIPLINHLTQVESEDVDFISDSGTVSSTSYKSSIDFDAIREFYLTTLSHMGWQLDKNDPNNLIFTRDNEKLEIDFIESETEDEDNEVVFSISSATK